MSHVEGYQCTVCHREYDTNEAQMYTCPPHCDDEGILDVIYDYKKNQESIRWPPV